MNISSILSGHKTKEYHLHKRLLFFGKFSELCVNRRQYLVRKLGELTIIHVLRKVKSTNSLKLQLPISNFSAEW